MKTQPKTEKTTCDQCGAKIPNVLDYRYGMSLLIDKVSRPGIEESGFTIKPGATHWNMCRECARILIVEQRHGTRSKSKNKNISDKEEGEIQKVERFHNIKIDRTSVSDMWLSMLPGIPEGHNGEGAIYVSEGTWITPGGDFVEW